MAKNGIAVYPIPSSKQVNINLKCISILILLVAASGLALGIVFSAVLFKRMSFLLLILRYISYLLGKE